MEPRVSFQFEDDGADLTKPEDVVLGQVESKRYSGKLVHWSPQQAFSYETPIR
jgi:hypothetical protein